MARALGGWWRLWIVLTVCYGGLVALQTWVAWPNVSAIQHDSKFTKQLSRPAQNVIQAPKTLSEMEQALIIASRSGDKAKAKALMERIDKIRRGGNWETAPIILEMPNGHRFEVSGDTSDADARLVAVEYVRTLEVEASRRRWAAIGAALLVWLVPSFLLCGFGLAVAWIIRGFKA